MRSSPVTPLSLHTGHWPPVSLRPSLAQESHREEAQQGNITASRAREEHRGQHSSPGRGGLGQLTKGIVARIQDTWIFLAVRVLVNTLKHHPYGQLEIHWT